MLASPCRSAMACTDTGHQSLDTVRRLISPTQYPGWGSWNNSYNSTLPRYLYINWRMASSGMLRRVALVRTDVWEEISNSIMRVTRTCVLHSVHQFLVTANVAPSSLILVNLMMEKLSSSETSVLTRVTRRNIPKDDILHSHRRENLQSYILRIILKLHCHLWTNCLQNVWDSTSHNPMDVDSRSEGKNYLLYFKMYYVTYRGVLRELGLVWNLFAIVHSHTNYNWEHLSSGNSLGPSCGLVFGVSRNSPRALSRNDWLPIWLKLATRCGNWPILGTGTHYGHWTSILTHNRN
jgi:hypothetical protein